MNKKITNSYEFSYYFKHFIFILMFCVCYALVYFLLVFNNERYKLIQNIVFIAIFISLVLYLMIQVLGLVRIFKSKNDYHEVKCVLKNYEGKDNLYFVINTTINDVNYSFKTEKIFCNFDRRGLFTYRLNDFLDKEFTILCNIKTKNVVILK